MQAVIKIGSSQYLVEAGQEIVVDHLTGPQKSLTFDQVLLTIDGSVIQVGQPFVPGVSVTATYLADSRGEKIRVAKFKAKSRYRKAVGFRATYSRIHIDSIQTNSSGKAASEEKPVHKTRRKKSV